MPKSPKAKTDSSWTESLMGKKGGSFKVEECQRILQEKGVEFTKHDNKKELVKKLAKCVKENGLRKTDRMRILAQPLYRQHIRWQVMSEDGEFAPHAYPTGTSAMVTGAIASALAEHEARRLGHNAKVCTKCKITQSELYFPTSIGSCCGKKAEQCRACIETHIVSQIDMNVDTHHVTCTECNATMKPEDIKPLTTAETYKKFVYSYRPEIMLTLAGTATSQSRRAIRQSYKATAFSKINYNDLWL
jgi:hypothetical protein